MNNIYDYPAENPLAANAYYDKVAEFSNKSTSAVVDETCAKPYCRALYDFKSDFPNELSFLAGELIYLLREVNKEWLEGESLTSGQKGIIPASFVDVVVPLSNFSMFDDNRTTGTSIIGVASILYDFEARYGDELQARSGESLNVLKLLGHEWVLCQNPVSGEKGLVPQTFLNVFLNESAENENLEAPVQTSDINFKRHQTSDINSTSQSSLDSTKPEISWINWGETSDPQQNSDQKHIHPPLPTVDIRFFEDPSKEYRGSFGFTESPPPRPPPPKLFTKNSSELLNLDEQSKKPISSQQTASISSDKKNRVVQELLATEQIYFSELTAWEECIKESNELNFDDKATLTNSLPALLELSSELINAINKEKLRSLDDQCYGAMFMCLRERFFKTFASHFRSVEQTSAIVENEADTIAQRALFLCLKSMKQRGLTVFDVPTMVSRPIQRCLKYPLYVGELIKNTPLNHCDHPKLLESLKQLSNLASKMNECKRRKELVRKYRREEQLTLADRFARFNLHTFKKKGNRLKYRIANKTIGFGTVKDSEFEYLACLLEEAERRVCKFIYLAQLYRKHLEWSIRRHEESYKNLCPAQNEVALKAFALMFRRADAFSREHLNSFESEILNQGRLLVRGELTKLVRKRNDKLADFETARAAGSGPEELDSRKNEFEALNSQVKTQLPRTIGTLNIRVVQLIKRLQELDSQFITNMDAWYVERPSLVKQFAQHSEPFAAFLLPQHRQTLLEMDRICKQLHHDSLTRNQSMEQLPTKQKFPLKLTKRMSMRTAPKRQQTIKERDALVKICRVQGQTDFLRRVVENYVVESFVVRIGDVVLVKSHHNGYSLCDNAVNTQYVPVSCLGPFDESFILSPAAVDTSASKALIDIHQESNTRESKATSQKPSTKAINEIPVTTKLGERRKSSTDLIDLGENLIDLNVKCEDSSSAVTPNVSSLHSNPFSITTLVQYEKEPIVIGKRPSQAPTDKQSDSNQKNWTRLFEDDWALISPVTGNKIKTKPSLHLLTSGVHQENLFANVGSSENSNSINPTLMSNPSATKKDAGQSCGNGEDPFFEIVREVKQSIQFSPSQEKKPQQLQNESISYRHVKQPSNVKEEHYKHPPLPRPLDFSTETLVGSVDGGFSERDLLPTRLAPLPPPPKRELIKTSDNDIMLCSFDFEPSPEDASVQLRLAEGQMVRVLQKSDDAGNAEWFLVQVIKSQENPEIDKTGFVPAAYLKPAGRRKL